MKNQTRIILAGMMGNLVESFDMAICGLLSLYLSKYLMVNTTTGLFMVFITFFAGYLARPLGAMFLGLVSDAYGRKITLAASILNMGLATTMIGFIPSSDSIGGTSMLMLFIFRIIQSFSSGAEYLNSSAYLVENAESTRKGYTGSWAPFGAMAGLLIASLITLLVNSLINQHPELEWAIWRFPFILALLGSTMGLYVRLCIPESLEYVMYYADNPKPKFKDLFFESMQSINKDKLTAVYVFLLSSLGVTTTFLIYIYAPIQAHLESHLTDQHIMTSNIISLIVMLAIFPMIGKLSDKINREKIVLAASCGFVALTGPYLYLLAHDNFGALVLVQSLIAIPAAAYYATVPVMLAETYPLQLRCTVLSVLYSIAASCSAGLTPLLSLLLYKKFENSTAPTVLVLILVILVCTVIWVKNLKRNAMSGTCNLDKSSDFINIL